jgi:hypothetical protein
MPERTIADTTDNGTLRLNAVPILDHGSLFNPMIEDEFDPTMSPPLISSVSLRYIILPRLLI